MGCGTWSWGNRLLWDYDESQDEEVYASYKLLRTAGVTIFDTADSYGTLDLNGRAEILLGDFERRYLRESGGTGTAANANAKPFWDLSKINAGGTRDSKNKQQVATKFAPYPWRLTRKSIVNAAESSLQRLNSKETTATTGTAQQEICIAQLHWSTRNYLPAQESVLWKGIADTYDAGLCQAVGVSNYGPQQLQRVASFMKERNVPLAIAQVQFSLMTFSDPQARDMLEMCQDLDCRLVSYSPLCLGLLTGKYTLDKLPKSPVRQQLFRELLPGAQELLSVLQVMALEKGLTCSQIALQWNLAKETVPIPGARTVRMAQENVGAAFAKPLSQTEVEELDRVAKRVSKPMINNIFQTN